MQIRRKKIALYILPLLILGGMFLFPDHVFAQDGEVTGKGTFDIIVIILKLFSWLWIVPAIIAGKLMSNDFVYGGFIHLDVYLFQMRQVMRTFANFALGFVFVGVVLKQFFKPGGTKEIADLVKNTFIAGIMIQLSWFLLAVLIDLSIIGVAAVAGVPSQVMQNQWDALRYDIKVQNTVDIIDGEISDEYDPLDDTNYSALELEDVIPKADNISGPLIFLGASVLNLMQYDFIEGTFDDGTVGQLEDYRQITLAVLLKVVVLILFVVPMIILMIINAYRVFRIWIWAIISPFIVLNVVFKPTINNDKINKFFSLKNIAGLIFQPVIVVGALALSMILIVGALDALQGGTEFDRETLQSDLQLEIQDEGIATLGAGPNSEITIIGGLQRAGEFVGGFIGEMILVLFVIFAMWGLVMVSFKSSEITDSIGTGIMKFAGQMAQNIPIPMLGVGVGGLTQGLRKQVSSTKHAIEGNYASNAEDILKRFNINNENDISGTELKDLKISVDGKKSGNTPAGKARSFWTQAFAISKEKPLYYRNDFKKGVEYWLSNGSGLQFLKSQGIITNPDINSVSDLYGDSASYANFSKYVDTLMTQGPDQVMVKPPFSSTLTSLDSQPRPWNNISDTEAASN